LAGGQGNRVQGQDKGLLLLAGEMLIQRVIRALSPQVEKVLISANRNIDVYESLGYQVIKDNLEGFAGPLAGICRILEELDNLAISPDFVVIVPCDAPMLPADLVSRLQAEFIGDDTLAVIPYDGTRLQPLFGLYSTGVLASLKEYLSNGDRKVGIWLESLPFRIVDFSDKADAFLNINTTTDLDAANSQFSKTD